MTDDKKNNFRAGFMADILKGLQEEYGIEKKPRGSGRRGKASKKPAEPKEKSGSRPAKPAPTGQGTAMPGIHMMHVTDEANPRPGDVLLGTYRVESRPFKGGMGAVWRVHHTGWDVDLAMKRPHPEAFRTEAQKLSFTDECRYWMNLGLHPNIVSCYYVREIDGVPTIFSEWMDNGSLESHIKNRTLYEGSEQEVQARLLDIAIQFARGLYYAHENDLIHQDVKPDNLLLTRDWSAKVSDFGLAKARTMLTFLDGTATEPENDPDATMVTPGGGRTPAYCSPEQAAAQLLTRRTDIYSWAVSVLEMYLGDKPWAHGRELTGPLVGVVCRDYFDMCVERPMPKALQDLLAKCLEMKPDDRPRDFGEVETQLLDIYREETGRRYPHPAPKGARDTADSLNNRAISHLDLGEEKEAISLLERCVRMRHFEGALNLALYRWRTGQTDVSSMFQAVDDLETLFWDRRGELDRIREEIYLEACGLPKPPEFKVVSAQVPQNAVMTTAVLVDGKLVAVVRKPWRDGNMYYYICHFDIDTGALLMQYPGDDEQPRIPYARENRYFYLFDGGRQLGIRYYSSHVEENGYYDVVSQKRIREYDDCRLNNGVYVLKDLDADKFFTTKGEVRPDFQDNVPLLGIKADAGDVYEIRRASTWEPCARIAAKKVTWLKDGQFLVHTKRDAFYLYDAETNTETPLFSRGRQDEKTVLKDFSKRIVVTPNKGNHGEVHEYKPGLFAMSVYRRFFTLPDLQELEKGTWKERTSPVLYRENLDYKPYKLSFLEVCLYRKLLSIPVPELPVLYGMNTLDHLLIDRARKCAVVYPCPSKVVWAVLHMDFCPPVTPQMRYRISTPLTTAAALEQERVDGQRLDEFRRAESGNSLRGMISVYRDAVFDDHTGYETLHAMNDVLSVRCTRRALLHVIGAPGGYFRKEKAPALLKDMEDRWAFSPSRKCYVKCTKSTIERWEYPSGTESCHRLLTTLPNRCEDYYKVTSFCFGQKDEVYIAYTCFMHRRGSNEDDYCVVRLAPDLSGDEIMLFMPDAGRGKVFLLGTTEDNRYLLMCRDDRKTPNTVSLDLLDLETREIVSSLFINDFVPEGEAFKRNAALNMLKGKAGAIELLWDYEPIPPEAAVSLYPSRTGMQIEGGILIKYHGEDEVDTVAIPEGVVEIGPEAFKGCELIRSVTVPDGVHTIGDEAFRGCIRLEKVEILSHALESIGKGAFFGCKELTRFDMVGNRIRTISDKTFESCAKLDKFEIPDSVTEIGDEAFNSTALTAIRFPSSLQRIGEYAFCYSKLEQVELPDQLVYIGKRAFSFCKFTQVTIPAGVDTLPEEVFYQCENLEAVKNEGSIRSIGNGAFGRCRKLKSVQVAYGAVVDKAHVLSEGFPRNKKEAPKKISIRQPIVIQGYEWDIFQQKKILICKVEFIPMGDK